MCFLLMCAFLTVAYLTNVLCKPVQAEGPLNHTLCYSTYYTCMYNIYIVWVYYLVFLCIESSKVLSSELGALVA